ncbi:hypothetical protein AAFC00_004799 [Neodothiora populina]|uniref:PHD-type domain-containing protein n=1 Tax=Neodothiora populina TaxID=2781224 RepID=A0ABR3P380_9PEZI
MPPAASARKGSTATDTNRRQSGRQPRTSTSRPINYYARPYGSLSGPVDEPQEQDPPGFFPAITYFADAVSALPKEVQRHVSLMKEVEAKVYGPTEALKTLSANILALPAPPRRNADPSTQGLLSFTASNSATASLNGSVINGIAPNPDRVSDVLDAANSRIDQQADLARRSNVRDLRHLIGNMIVNLDEKNNVMAEANRVLSQQLSRMDSVMPHVEAEISEEARLGSLTHWAYAENRVKKQPAPAHERARRDVAATSNLAAAAAAVHDNDIAAARGQATRESKKSKHHHHHHHHNNNNNNNNNNNHHHHAESDFDDKPVQKRAAPAKARKEAADGKVAGLGITEGAPAKRRKVDKVATPAMERSASALKNGRGGNTTPRSTPQAEPAAKQKKKPGPAPGFVPVKKRNQAAAALNSGDNSPVVASSPLLNNVQAELASAQRPASSRNRQNSSTSNLQYSLLAGGHGAEEERERSSQPTSAPKSRTTNSASGASGTNGAININNNNNNNNHDIQRSTEQANTALAASEDKMDIDREQELENNKSADRKQGLKQEEMATSDAQQQQQQRQKQDQEAQAQAQAQTQAQEQSHSRPPEQPTRARAPKTSTPLAHAAAPDSPVPGSATMVRTRSNRGTNSRTDVADKNDMDRHRSVPGQPTSDADSDDEERNQVREGVTRGATGSASTSGSVSGGGGGAGHHGARSSSRRSAPRTVASVSAAAAAAAAAVIAGNASMGGRSSRASRQRGRDTEPPRSAPHSRSRNITPEAQQIPPLEADHDDQEEDGDERVGGRGSERAAAIAVDDHRHNQQQQQQQDVAATVADTRRHRKQQEPVSQQVDDEEEEEEEEDDPNEPRYCYCGRGSWGEMIACDNPNCTMEWFHLTCTGLRSVPADNVKWFCDMCKSSMGHNGRGKKGRPGSRHAASGH